MSHFDQQFFNEARVAVPSASLTSKQRKIPTESLQTIINVYWWGRNITSMLSLHLIWTKPFVGLNFENVHRFELLSWWFFHVVFIWGFQFHSSPESNPEILPLITKRQVCMCLCFLKRLYIELSMKSEMGSVISGVSPDVLFSLHLS